MNGDVAPSRRLLDSGEYWVWTILRTSKASGNSTLSKEPRPSMLSFSNDTHCEASNVADGVVSTN